MKKYLTVMTWLLLGTGTSVMGQVEPLTCAHLAIPPINAQVYLSWSDQPIFAEDLSDDAFSNNGGVYEDGIACDPVIHYHTTSLNAPTNTTNAVYVMNATDLDGYWSAVVDAKLVNVTLLHGHRVNFDVMTVKAYTGIQSLALRGGVLPAIPPDFFVRATFRNLLVLDLSANNITRLERDVFRNIRQLTVFVFSDNPLQSYDPAIFCNLYNLYSITMNNAFHHGFPSDLFSRQSLLDLQCNLDYTYSYTYILRLSRNTFPVLPNASMDALVWLQNELQLADCSIMLIESDAFIGLNNLEILFLNDNQFVELPLEVFTPLGNLIQLIAPTGLLRDFSGEHFSNHPKLNTIDLFGNDLMNISGSVSALHELHRFDAGSNNLTSISAATFSETKNLYYLSFRGNNISTIEGSFVDVNYGENVRSTLDLSQNFLTQLETTLLDASYLVNTLYLDHNQLTYLPEDFFSQQTKMEELHLQENRFEDLSCEVFNGLTALHTLDISNNTIRTLCDSVFQQLPNLERLDLSHNDIAEVTEAMFHGVTDLRELHLNGNQLTSLNASLFSSRSKSLHAVYLGGNAWHCDCQLNSLIGWIRSNQDKVHDVDDMRCASPSSLLNQDVRTALIACPTTASESESKPEAEDYNDVIVALVCALVGCIIIMAILMIFRHDIVILLHARLGVHFGSDPFPASSRKFDAFVSFSQRDLDFVLKQLMPRLEKSAQRPYKLCVHYRDFEVGASIAENISWAINNSQRTILVLSQHFLTSEWCQFEFSKAHHNVINEGHGQVIVIIMSDIKACDVKDRELQSYLKTHTYIERDDRLFWERLLYAMPHSTVNDHKPAEQAGIPMEEL